MRIHTTAKLSENMNLTPEGYLLCEGAALARVGAMAYLPEEVPEDITKGFGGQEVMIWRSEAEVFRPETLASFEGKPFTLDHPDEDVSPENWAELDAGLPPENLQARLGDLYPQMDETQLAELMARALFVAEVWGRVNGR